MKHLNSLLFNCLIASSILYLAFITVFFLFFLLCFMFTFRTSMRPLASFKIYVM